MGRWNNGSSIHIKTIPKEQIGEAIEEWAEGSEPLKDLLWSCYERGILTDECHWGGGSYISFEGTDSVEELKKMIRNVGDIDHFQMLCRESAMNPISLMKSGNEPSFSMGVLQHNRESGTLLFSRLRQGLDLDLPQDIAFEKVLDFYKAFEGKETGLHFRLRHSNDEGYRFSIESHEKEHNVPYFEELFTKAGLKKDELDPDYPVISWSIQSEYKEEFDQMMTKAYDTITKEWSLEEPTEILDDMSFMMKLRIMYKKLAGTPEGREELYKWGIENAPDYILRDAGIKRPINNENER